MDSARQGFLDSFLESYGPTLDPTDRLELEQIAEGHLETLTAVRSGYFEPEDLPRLSTEAGRRLATQFLLQNHRHLKTAWQSVAEDFHRNQYWGFKTQDSRPRGKRKEKNEVASFLWTLFQAAVLMKFIILYFGINAAEQESEWHYTGLGLALFVSFSSLLYFAYRKSKTYKD
ncbi:MAG: hypothetical protein ACK5Y2_10935 [Bdellovibrionales bacterium]